MHRYQGLHSNRFEGHPKRSYRKGHSDPWTTAASSPSGARLLHAGLCGTSDARSALSANWNFNDPCATFGMFTDRLALLRRRLCHAVAQAETMIRKPDVSEEDVRILATAIQSMAYELKKARRSRYGWQDIHADDVRISAQSREYCTRLLARLPERSAPALWFA